MIASTVDDFYIHIDQVLGALDRAKETSLRIWASDHLTRSLILVIANHFENEVTSILRHFLESQSPNKMVKAYTLKASERKYFTYFNFGKEKNVNNFLTLFGDEFKDLACEDINSKPELKEGMLAFLELGGKRDELTHRKPHEVDLPKSVNEYYDHYKKALIFVNYLKEKFK